MNPSTIQASLFRLTQPELIFMLRLLELPNLPGIGEKPWGEIDLETARRLFGEAGLALQLRGWATVDENRQPIVDPVLKQLLYASAYPSQMMTLAYKHTQGPVTKIFHYRRNDLVVRQELLPDLVHEFYVDSSSDMGQADFLDIFEGYDWKFVTPIIKISGQLYDQAVENANEHVELAEKILIKAGVLPQFASRMSEAFAGFDLKVNIQWVYEINPNLNISSATFWVSKTSCWIVETALQEQSGMVRVTAVDYQAFKTSVFSAFQVFDNAL